MTLEYLKDQRKKLASQLERAQTQVTALSGALAFCDHLIGAMAGQPAASPKEPANVDLPNPD